MPMPCRCDYLLMPLYWCHYVDAISHWDTLFAITPFSPPPPSCRFDAAALFHLITLSWAAFAYFAISFRARDDYFAITLPCWDEAASFAAAMHYCDAADAFRLPCRYAIILFSRCQLMPPLRYFLPLIISIRYLIAIRRLFSLIDAAIAWFSFSLSFLFDAFFAWCWCRHYWCHYCAITLIITLCYCRSSLPQRSWTCRCLRWFSPRLALIFADICCHSWWYALFHIAAYWYLMPPRRRWFRFAIFAIIDCCFADYFFYASMITPYCCCFRHDTLCFDAFAAAHYDAAAYCYMISWCCHYFLRRFHFHTPLSILIIFAFIHYFHFFSFDAAYYVDIIAFDFFAAPDAGCHLFRHFRWRRWWCLSITFRRFSPRWYADFRFADADYFAITLRAFRWYCADFVMLPLLRWFDATLIFSHYCWYWFSLIDIFAIDFSLSSALMIISPLYFHFTPFRHYRYDYYAHFASLMLLFSSAMLPDSFDIAFHFR